MRTSGAFRYFRPYAREARRWGDTLVITRNGLEHGDWQLPRVAYTPSGNSIIVAESLIDGQPVTAFVNQTADRLNCFVEDVTIHCIQRHMPAGLSFTEIPLSHRSVEMPSRF